jgi:hypothetical protein
MLVLFRSHLSSSFFILRHLAEACPVTLLTMMDSVERAAAAGSSQRSWSTTAVKHEKFLTRVHEEFPTSSSAYSLNLAKFSEEFPTRSSTRISTRSSKREVLTSSTIAGLKMINALNLEHDVRDEAKALWEATKSGVASGSGSGAGVASGAMPGAGVASGSGSGAGVANFNIDNELEEIFGAMPGTGVASGSGSGAGVAVTRL